MGARTRKLRRVLAHAGLALFAACLMVPATADATSQRVPDDYYGATFGRIWFLSPELRDRHLASMEDLGIDQIHLQVDWKGIEPNSVATGNSYQWHLVDDVIGAMAEHGIRARIVLAGTPKWAEKPLTLADRLRCGRGTSSFAPADWTTPSFANAMGAVASRYGRGGSFWANHPALPKEQVHTYEVWNEENASGVWCPEPNPELYADYFMAAQAKVRQADPNAGVVVGSFSRPAQGQNQPYYYTIPDFVQRVLARQPGILGAATAFGVHAYPGPQQSQVTHNLSVLRNELRAGGVPNSMPMALTEIGWRTYGTADSISEAQRTTAYQEASRYIPNTNCNISNMIAHAWMTHEVDTSSGEDFYGISVPTTGAPHPSAIAFSEGIALMRGQTAVEGPHEVVDACEGMPVPDRDDDGVDDSDDYYPDDPDRNTGPPGWDGGGGEPECQLELRALKEKMAALKGRRAQKKILAQAGSLAAKRALRRLKPRITATKAQIRALMASCPS